MIGYMLEKDMYNFLKPLIRRRPIKWSLSVLVLCRHIGAMFEKYTSDFRTFLSPWLLVPTWSGRHQM
jgi:hypothetical protein